MDLSCIEEPNQNTAAIMKKIQKLKAPLRAPASLPPKSSVQPRRFTFQTEGGRARVIGKGSHAELMRFGVDSFVEYEGSFVKSWWLVVDNSDPIYVIKMNSRGLYGNGTPSSILRCKAKAEAADNR